MNQEIIKEKFTINEQSFFTLRVATPQDENQNHSIGSSLYNQSKLKMKDGIMMVEKNSTENN